MPRQYITCSSCNQVALVAGRGLCSRCYQRAYQSGTLPPKPAKPLIPKPPKRPKHTERIARSCGGCGTTIMMQVAESNRTGTAYCSPKCRSRKVEHTCPGCGIRFLTGPRRLRICKTHYCSKRCWTAQSQPKGRPRIQGWRSAVLRRDGRACQRCRATTDLHAHHIKPWAKYPELRYVVANGVTLCGSCHRFEHSTAAIEKS